MLRPVNGWSLLFLGHLLDAAPVFFHPVKPNNSPADTHLSPRYTCMVYRGEPTFVPSNKNK